MDATVHTVISSRYQVQGYPTIKVFAAGVKDAHSVENYEGARDANGIVQYALDKVAESIEPPEVQQITSTAVWKDNCDEKQICVVAILPHILDSGAEGRNSYIGALKELGEKYKKRMWGWVWSEGAAQLKLEEALGIGGFGYPAMAAVNVRKMKYAILKGSFDRAGIDEFLRAVSVGRGSTAPIQGAAIPDIEQIEPWDGKDGEMPVEEDFDFDDEEEPAAKEELWRYDLFSNVG